MFVLINIDLRPVILYCSFGSMFTVKTVEMYLQFYTLSLYAVKLNPYE